jgi:hypothetical protein
MWYKQQLKRVRKARKAIKQQQNQLLVLELEGVIAVQLHTLTSTLSLTVPREVTSQVADLLREALSERLTMLKADASQLLDDQQESKEIQAQDKALLKDVKKN